MPAACQAKDKVCPSWSLTGTDGTAAVTAEGAKKCSKDGHDGVSRVVPSGTSGKLPHPCLLKSLDEVLPGVVMPQCRASCDGSIGICEALVISL